ncbi:M56 family metallopeptidase [Deinococcus radiopugnans]|uniref:M56 family metallopeptidase n=1 Tax=Deinococcus radiopugnans ATCC 19172 TaxID=585398 RepID=A0A5C4Y9W3_9DEIO|nr:M56 family metallopeptidase [Deinococcus radiopugnans]MBB6015990.1 Zn-dependent protease with chaperone function [Deinococcus radiopugnans ATCC 19172]TNM72323.1 M56 family metallopeptidase [Deinococcus radiopugnans ATCC 19172]
MKYLFYPQFILTVWGPLLVFGLAWLLRPWRQTLAPRAGFWLSLGLLLLPVLMWYVPYLPGLALREWLPYRAPISWGVYNGPQEFTHWTWWLTTLPFLLGFGGQCVAAAYGLAEQAVTRWRVRCLPQYRVGRINVLEVPGELAFTLSCFRPHIYVSRAVWEGPHRAAILAHEEGHASARHPLLLALALWAARSCWFWPPAQILLHEVRTWADQQAAQTTGRPALARALRHSLNVAAGPSIAPSFASPSIITRRVQRLSREGRPLPLPLVLGLLGLYLALLVLV